MAGAGKLLAAEFPGLFAGVLRGRGGKRGRKGEVPLLLPEGGWDSCDRHVNVGCWGCIGCVDRFAYHELDIQHDTDTDTNDRGGQRPIRGAAAVGGRRGAGSLRAVLAGG